jgi:hypothetical protein
MIWSNQLKIEAGYYRTLNVPPQRTLAQAPSRADASSTNVSEEPQGEPLVVVAATSSTRGSKRSEVEEQPTGTDKPRKRRKEPTMFIPKKRT